MESLVRGAISWFACGEVLCIFTCLYRACWRTCDESEAHVWMRNTQVTFQGATRWFYHADVRLHIFDEREEKQTEHPCLTSFRNSTNQSRAQGPSQSQIHINTPTRLARTSPSSIHTSSSTSKSRLKNVMATVQNTTYDELMSSAVCPVLQILFFCLRGNEKSGMSVVTYTHGTIQCEIWSVSGP
jgi:hypothetical protein